ncbi:hypothetical protein ACGFX2_20330 [Streptomyces goshikiensis]|uniref:hypothetical protein n=1 Tax=Streptomyces goshikiensis TaxID=1942 RepID=UPI0037248366
MEQRVALVRDQPEERYALAREFYRLAAGPVHRYGHGELRFRHAMLARPRLALGRFAAALGPRLADPRHRTVQMFLDLGRSFPPEYPCPRPPATRGGRTRPPPSKSRG